MESHFFLHLLNQKFFFIHLIWILFWIDDFIKYMFFSSTYTFFSRREWNGIELVHSLHTHLFLTHRCVLRSNNELSNIHTTEMIDYKVLLQ